MWLNTLVSGASPFFKSGLLIEQMPPVELNPVATTELEKVARPVTFSSGLKVTGTIASQSSAVFGQMVRIRDSRVTRGTTPSTNYFTQVYFGDSTIGADVSGLENINGFLEMGIRSDGRTDLKMVALRNEPNSDNSYSASLSVVPVRRRMGGSCYCADAARKLDRYRNRHGCLWHEPLP